MGYSKPPGTLEAFKNGVGFVMNCRPRGGYSHSHQSNGGFELFAYGQTIATGGGRRSNSDFFAKSSQSHNVVLIDGLGQGEVEGSKAFPNAGRIKAWKETPDLVYACSDVRNAYIKHPQLQRFLRHFLFVRNRYFVVFDDLALMPDAKSSLFSWLYHVQAEVPVQISETRFEYAIEDVHVQVHHLGETGPLGVENMQGDKWYTSPITGENFFEKAREKALKKPGLEEIWAGLPRIHNNLWVTTEHRHEAQFLAVIAPWQEGDEVHSFRKLTNVEVASYPKKWGNFTSNVNRTNIQMWEAPNTVHVHLEFENDENKILINHDHIMTPETDTTTHYFMDFTRNFGLDGNQYPTDDEIYNEQHSVISGDDLPMVEAQQENINLCKGVVDVPVKADKLISAVHRHLADMYLAQDISVPSYVLVQR